MHFAADITGAEIMRTLRDEARNRVDDITVLEFMPAVELILNEHGQCCGAVLYNMETQEYTVVRAKAVVMATGVQLRQLQIPGPREFPGARVYYGAALSEARYFTEQRVVVIGGANSAGQGAMFFSRYAREVLILVRADRLEKGMSAYLVEQIRSQSNIRVLTRAEALAFEGVERLEKVRIVHRDTGMEEVIAAPAAFIFIGARACTDWLPDPVACDPAGFVLTDTLLPREGTQPKDWPLKRDPFFLETSVPGIFAAGDVRTSAIRRVASAVGQGAMAISLVHQYLKEV